MFATYETVSQLPYRYVKINAIAWCYQRTATAGFAYWLSRLKSRASEKMKGVITNNKDPFSFLGNQPSRAGMGNIIFGRKQDIVRTCRPFFFLALPRIQNFQ